MTTTSSNNGIDEAIRLAGGQKELAKALGVTQQAVSKWARDGYVPLRRAREIEAVYGIARARLINPKIRDLVDLPEDNE